MGPRDGLQNEKNSIPLRTKIELIRRLAKTGVRTIEAGSFVAPKWVPQVCGVLFPWDEVVVVVCGHGGCLLRGWIYCWIDWLMVV